jgi:UPF0176 protein
MGEVPEPRHRSKYHRHVVTAPYTVTAFYKFVPFADPKALQEPLREACEESCVVGTILLATEGINGSLAGTDSAVAQVLARLRAVPGLHDLESKETPAEELPFHRIKVKVKREIVTLRAPADPTKRVGAYVKPREWNQLLDDPEIVLVDTRNDYEVAEGTFPGALDPKTAKFSEFPAWVTQNLDPAKHKKVAMFCTGGIRCEKATAYLLELGFENVFHLQGGILKYQLEIPESESRFIGKNFVFDDRRTFG